MPILFATESLFRDELSDTSYLTTGSSVLRFEWSRHPLVSVRGHCPTVLPFQRLHVQLVYPSLKYPLPQKPQNANTLKCFDETRSESRASWIGHCLPILCAAGGCSGQRPRDHRHTRFAQRHHDHRRQATSAARSEIRRRDQGERRCNRKRGGRRASCRPKARPTCC